MSASDTDDFSRRTLLANERTYLAWWRTGLTTLTVALAAARVVPGLARGSVVQWPYTVIGAGFALLGILCVAYAERRRVAVDRAIRRGDFAGPDHWVTLVLTAGGTLLGLGLLAVIVIDP